MGYFYINERGSMCFTDGHDMAIVPRNPRIMEHNGVDRFVPSGRSRGRLCPRPYVPAPNQPTSVGGFLQGQESHQGSQQVDSLQGQDPINSHQGVEGNSWQGQLFKRPRSSFGR